MEIKEKDFPVAVQREKIYPILPSAPQEEDVNNYRIQKILDIQNTIEKEKEQRRKTFKKYSKVITCVDVTDEVLATATVGFGVTGIALLSTIAATRFVCFIKIYK